MIVYVDGSVKLRIILEDGDLIAGWERWTATFSIDLSYVECRRVLDRLRLTGELGGTRLSAAIVGLERIEAECTHVPVRRDVIERASMSLTKVVRTLDAIHLATAIILRESGLDLVFATHDRQQAVAAATLGFTVIGVNIA